ncbi:negative regulator of flagellin synthesis FlgM [Paraburkholderia bannensis]|uniref:Negative regulator of flagellin synthesis n=1 Tax=Paraburkholderia bannensis TaxID=765414 RepID=A0A7W9TSV7_9BURK|nr:MULTISPECIES: flagellar biosynthesis anti-sigma factor FlgM [Paraburkholderia]MBB3255838.1 negative regulator of flagellin synthesis FlgM [Paraburkholderia sp. WP4_3_2]MBB6100838.1 negative regulator of flagellin synthesis FlgM [Paraburkholderia bannensis]
MKIDTSNRNDALPLQDGLTRAQQGETASTATTAGATSSAPAASAASAQSTSSDANVSLSNLSSSLRSLAASGSADIDTAHVQSIKDAIKNGTLQIDTGKIADGILETARGLVKPAASGS